MKNILGQIEIFFKSLKTEKRSISWFENFVHAYNFITPTPDVLFLGDSVVERVSNNDSDKRTLGDMVVQGLAKNGITTRCITHSAFHFGVFFCLLKTFKYFPNRPKLVVFPINIRTFSPQWYFNPKWRFDEEIEAINKYSGKRIPLYVKVENLRKSWKAYLNTNVRYSDSTFGTIKQFRDVIDSKPQDHKLQFIRRKYIFMFHYMFSLQRNHPRLLLLEDMINFLLAENFSVIVYYTPVNFNGGTKYAGENFLNVLKINIGIVEKMLSVYRNENNVKVLNFCTSLSSDFFFSEHEPTEHLNQEGRIKIAETLTNEITSIFQITHSSEDKNDPIIAKN